MKRILLALLAATTGLGAMAQASAQRLIARDPLPENSYSPVTNINRNGFPRILEGGEVMFRLSAPNATLMQVDLGGRKYDMEKMNGGLWTVITQPQAPGFHYYSLVVDGVSVSDPASYTYYGCSRVSSAIDIKEEGMDDFEVQDVPHGQVRTLNYWSELEKAWRPICVYTPAGYEKGRKKYPVVYIHHGGGEDHTGWMQQGRVANILDNLIAGGKAVPMIVVSPNSNITRTGGGMGGYSREGMQPYFEELSTQIIPFIDKTFRTKADARHRAMCGLSMGGGQTFYIGLNHPELFASIGIFSTGMFGGIQQAKELDLENEVPGILSETGKFNSRFDVFYMTCGEQDPRIEHTRKMADKMKQAGIDIEFQSFPGDHEWQPWRKSIHAFAQKLFK